MTCQGTPPVSLLRLRTDTKILRTLRPRHHKIMSESQAGVGPPDTASIAHARPHGPGWPVATIGALGVVFGDIGTSPIYTIQTIFNPEDPHPVAASTESVYGLRPAPGDPGLEPARPGRAPSACTPVGAAWQSGST
jgi:hypothetical protein